MLTEEHWQPVPFLDLHICGTQVHPTSHPARTVVRRMVAPSDTCLAQGERALPEDLASSCNGSRREKARPAAYCAVGGA